MNYQLFFYILMYFFFIFKFDFLGFLSKLIFAITFFIIRIVIGSYVTYELWKVFIFQNQKVDIYCIPSWLSYSVLFVNILFHILNLYWFAIIVGNSFNKKEYKKENNTNNNVTNKTHQIHPVENKMD